MMVEVNSYMIAREVKSMIAHIISCRAEERRAKLQKAKDQNYKPARSYLFGLLKFPERILTDEQAAEVIKLEEYPPDWDDVKWEERERTAQYILDACAMSIRNQVQLSQKEVNLMAWWAKESGRELPFIKQEAA